MFRFELPLDVVAGAAMIATLAALLGGLSSVRRAVRLPPAEAMRPEPPANYRPTLFERLGLQRLLSHTARMVLRKLEREPFKAGLSCFGISMAVAVLVLGNFMNDALGVIIETHFELAQRQDAMLTFVEPGGAQAFYDARRLPGVTDAEPFRGVAARLRFGPRHKRAGVMGLSRGGRLFRLIDSEQRVVEPPAEGLMISKKLGEMLNAGLGDELTVEVMEGERPTRLVPIVAMIEDYAGANAYMEIGALRRLMREGGTVSGAFIATDVGRLDEFYAEVKRTPSVASVTVTDAMLESFNETVAENQAPMRLINVGFAMVIAFGVVYNMARISLTERQRELATLRVIGFTRGEVSVILLGELAVLTGIALPLGMLIGYGFAAAATHGFETEMYRIPLVVERATFAFAAVVTLIAAVISGLVVRDRVDRLDLVGALKSQE
jgi:putative ABC transport system permease protein